MTIFTRLFIGNMIILALILVMGFLVLTNLTRLKTLHLDISEKQQESLNACDRLKASVTRMIRLDEKFFITRDPDYLNGFKAQVKTVEDAFKTGYPGLETIDQKLAFDNASNAFQAYLAWFLANAQPSSLPELSMVDTLSRQRQPLKTKMDRHILSIEEATRTLINQKTRQSAKMTRQIFSATRTTTVLTVLAGIIITLVNSRSIQNSVGRLKEKTREIAQGKFEEITTPKGPREIQDLTAHFNTMCRRLGELDELKGDFISHVSHELRTPVTSIKEAAHMLSKGYYDNRPDKQKQLSGIIETECRRLLKYVIRVLDFSKMEAGKMEYSHTRLHLPDILRTSILKLAPLAIAKDISLEFEPPPPDLPDITGDENRLIEVVDNLVGNAIKFTPRNGKITIDCHSAAQEQKVRVRVTDTGPGIALDHREKIFYKFKQIDNDLNTRMGTGLGLSISKYIIVAHKGTIWAENMPSGGTRVSFTLPASSWPDG